MAESHRVRGRDSHRGAPAFPEDNGRTGEEGYDRRELELCCRTREGEHDLEKGDAGAMISVPIS